MFLKRRRQPPPNESGALSLGELETRLLSDDLRTRVFAALRAPELGPEALLMAARIARDLSVHSQSRVWALQAAARFIGTSTSEVNALAIHALDDPAAEVRALALQLLDQTRPSEALAAIAALQDDFAENPNWWGYESATIGATARELLRAIGTPAALALIKHS